MHGGGHERGLRSGTLPVPLIVGFGAACRLGMAEREREAARLTALRERLWSGLAAALPGLHRHGHATEQLPGNLSVAFEGIQAEGLLLQLRDVALSAGSACTAASPEPSHVLLACGVSPDLAHATVRFGLGRGNTAPEIDQVVAEVARVVRALRAHAAPVGAERVRGATGGA
jgi:cysteine desulfurase